MAWNNYWIEQAVSILVFTLYNPHIYDCQQGFCKSHFVTLALTVQQKVIDFLIYIFQFLIPYFDMLDIQAISKEIASKALKWFLSVLELSSLIAVFDN